MFYCLFCGAEAHSWKDLRAHQAACARSAGITPRPDAPRSKRVRIARDVVEHVLNKVLPTISDFSRSAAKATANYAGYKPFENIDQLLTKKG